jgi:clan AA aspartic protease
MISGTVRGFREAVVPLKLRGPGGAEVRVEAVIDTGFSGALTISPATVAALGLVRQSDVTVRLGDGTVRQLDVYDVEVEWDGAWLAALVTEIDGDPLIGMRLLAGHELRMAVVPGGVVEITPLP